MKTLLLVVGILGASLAAYAANCCAKGAACCPGPCCESAKK